MLVRDWSQLAIEKGDYVPQVEALIAGGAGARNRPAPSRNLNAPRGTDLVDSWIYRR